MPAVNARVRVRVLVGPEFSDFSVCHFPKLVVGVSPGTVVCSPPSSVNL